VHDVHDRTKANAGDADARARERRERGRAAAPQLAWECAAAAHVVEVVGRVPQGTLAAIARSAIVLLGGAQRERLRRCQRPGCVLVFVAVNPRRRWRSTATCGNRVRVARHYARNRPTRPRPPA